MTDTAGQLAIVVLNYQDYEMSQKCVSNLLAIGVESPVFLVDNASPNASYEKLKSCFSGNKQVTVVQSDKNGGYSYGNNYGIHLAGKAGNVKYICIMNPDVILEQNFLGDLCNILSQHDDYAAISVLMFRNHRFEADKISWPIPTKRSLYRELSLLQRDCPQKFRHDVLEGSLVQTETLPGSFFIIKYEIFKQIGFFDENVFLYNEENILGIKLKQKGYKCVLDTSRYYLHNHPEYSKDKVIDRYKHEFGSILRDYRYSYMSRKYLCKAYYHRRNSGKLFLVHVMNLLMLYIKKFYIEFMYRDRRRSREKKKTQRSEKRNGNNRGNPSRRSGWQE